MFFHKQIAAANEIENKKQSFFSLTVEDTISLLKI